MKTFHSIQVLEEPSLRLYIDQTIANIAGLRKDVILNAMALIPNKTENKNPLTPDISIISSHFPVGSWANLFRASFTIKPGRGSLSKLITSLNEIGLLVRFIESTDGINLRSYTIRVGSKPDHQKIDLLNNSHLSPLIIPSSLLVLEIPEKTKDFFKNTPTGIFNEISDLHKEIKSIISGKNTEVSKVRMQLERLLKERHPKTDVSIDWLSTMTCLNRLGNLDSFQSRDKNTEAGKPFKKNKDFALMFRTRARKKFHIQSDSNKLYIDATPWRSIFWHGSEHIPDERKITRPPELLSVSYTDSNEKITCWNLFRETAVIVVEFRVISPSKGLEHLWWEWIMKSISTGQGSLLTSNSSARIDGGWTTFYATAIFPFDPKNRDHIKQLLKCFKGIQRLDQDRAFEEALNNEKLKTDQSLEGLMQKTIPGTPTKECTLQILSIFDPQRETSRPYQKHFKPNPYFFTKPLNHNDYVKVYGAKETYSTRVGLANRIIDRIKDGENISIVGAHRTGKTTVQNLVHDLLNLYEEGQQGTYYIPIKINASTTPPHAIYSKITEEINKWLEHPSNKTQKSFLNKAKNKIKQTISNTREKLRIAKIRLGSKSNYVEFQPQKETEEIKDIKQATWEITHLTKEQDTYVINTTLEDLRDFLQDISTDFTTKNTETKDRQQINLILVIIIDEVKGISEWESDAFTRIWRHVIESEDYQNLRWLISATKPITHERPFSPVMNVFKEYNVGSLTSKECELLISSFDNNTQSSKPKLTPLITHESKVFLSKFSSRLPYFIQIFLYHIYNYTTRKSVPITNVTTCKKVIYSMVLGELSDYLKKQWIDIETDIQQNIISILRKTPKDPYVFMDSNLDKILNEENFSSRTRKILLRSGLSGDDKLIVAPIVALWLITEGYCSQNATHS